MNLFRDSSHSKKCTLYGFSVSKYVHSSPLLRTIEQKCSLGRQGSSRKAKERTPFHLEPSPFLFFFFGSNTTRPQSLLMSLSATAFDGSFNPISLGRRPRLSLLLSHGRTALRAVMVGKTSVGWMDGVRELVFRFFKSISMTRTLGLQPSWETLWSNRLWTCPCLW